MDWKKLKQNKCPKCFKKLDYEEGTIFCNKCDFSISTMRMREVIADIEAKEMGEYNKAKILCDRCKVEFMGPEYLMYRKGEVLCDDCKKDAECESNF